MRKADYAALAAVIAACNKAGKDSRPYDPVRFDGYLAAIDAIAYQFAARASVNRAEFLKACGITP
jgi:hypothetical protein